MFWFFSQLNHALAFKQSKNHLESLEHDRHSNFCLLFFILDRLNSCTSAINVVKNIVFLNCFVFFLLRLHHKTVITAEIMFPWICLIACRFENSMHFLKSQWNTHTHTHDFEKMFCIYYAERKWFLEG